MHISVTHGEQGRGGIRSFSLKEGEGMRRKEGRILLSCDTVPIEVVDAPALQTRRVRGWGSGH